MKTVFDSDEEEIVMCHAELGDLSDEDKFKQIGAERGKKPNYIRTVYQRALRELKEHYGVTV